MPNTHRPYSGLPGFEPTEWNDDYNLRVLSLGAGVQSVTVALLAESGELGTPPDAAIFADTGWEPQSTHDTVEWLSKKVSFPIYTVSNGRNLRDDVMAGVDQTGKSNGVFIPAFTSHATKGIGIIKRQCTVQYKIIPIRRKFRQLLGLSPNASTRGILVEQWMGISTDEAARMRTADVAYIRNYYPLVESMGWSRTDCLDYLSRNVPDWTPAKSACIGCPFHDNAMWQDMLANRPAVFADAVEVDERLRADD